ncbi:MAG: histidine--tRNA ligase, partial [Parvibaculales bacterium]
MPESKKKFRPKPLLPAGFEDYPSEKYIFAEMICNKLLALYQQYGFLPLETPAIEYSEALGKFLPDRERPNDGVFSLQDEDGKWLSLRYDLTAPLARFVARHYDSLPKPFRRVQAGFVFRNEKAGPGRFRQFIQLDADIVGGSSAAVEAELCMLGCQAMEVLGMGAGEYVLAVNHRGIMAALMGVLSIEADSPKAGAVLRAMDKWERLGAEGVAALLGEGRKDKSGDFTKGAGLSEKHIGVVMGLMGIGGSRKEVLAEIGKLLPDAEEALSELAELDEMLSRLGFSEEKIIFSPAIVRGLEYYTGIVFEISLTDTGGLGSDLSGAIGGGGRYDGLVERFKGVKVPACGISLGISRLIAILEARGKLPEPVIAPLIMVAVFDKQHIGDDMVLVHELRGAGLTAELYMGDGAVKAQLKYADQRGVRFVLLQGEDDRARGSVTVKNLALGAKAAREITDNEKWRASEHAQVEIK